MAAASAATWYVKNPARGFDEEQFVHLLSDFYGVASLYDGVYSKMVNRRGYSTFGGRNAWYCLFYCIVSETKDMMARWYDQSVVVDIYKNHDNGRFYDLAFNLMRPSQLDIIQLPLAEMHMLYIYQNYRKYFPIYERDADGVMQPSTHTHKGHHPELYNEVMRVLWFQESLSSKPSKRNWTSDTIQSRW